MNTNGGAELRSLGYRWNGRGWVLEEPDAKPPHRPGLCKGCQKFDGNKDWDNLCAGCMWYGRGNPHGLDREGLRERLRARKEEAS